MTVIRSLLLLAATACIGSAADFNGTWKAVFTGPAGEQPKMVSEMEFHLSTEGNRLTGSAHLGNWPGDGPVTDGRVDGDRFTFTVQTENAWRAGSALGHSSGLPKLTFSGTLKDGELEIHLVWDSIMLYGDAPAPKEYAMHGVRVETAAR